MEEPAHIGPAWRALMDPRRMLRVIATASVVAGVLTFVSILVPHGSGRYNEEYLLVALGLVLFGVGLRVYANRVAVGVSAIHVANVVLSGCVLALTWLGMVDVGGVQAVFLLLPLVVSASLGPLRWASLLLVAQSAGYALVLATSDPVLGLDRQTQWLVVTMGLVVALVYQDMMRRELADAGHRLAVANAELREANELKGRFVAMASHELRTPLTAISGFSATMVDRWDSLSDADKQSFVGIIDEQSGRLGRLVSDLLLLSKVEGGRLDPPAGPVALAPVVERTLRHLGMDDVPVRCDPAVVVLASEDHVEQILVNLLGNAASHGGAVERITAQVDADAWVVLCVSDNGPGVPPEFVPRLFDRFSQFTDTDHERPHGGVGLGLSIVAGLARAHRGDAWYEPNQPVGSRFCVRLPAS